MRSYVKLLIKNANHRLFIKRHYTPRRALLYVPGSDQKKINKIESLNVDCAVLDCEDGVAINKKEEARLNICNSLNKTTFGTNKEICVRVNSVDSEFCQQDLNAVLQNERLPSTLVLPKVESEEHIEWFSEVLKKSIKSEKQTKLKLIMMVESAKSLLDFRDICKKAMKLAKSSPMQPEAVIFGSDDYCADIGATRTSGASELLYARQRLVTVAKMYRLQAIDLVHIDYKDLEGLKITSEESSRMGFTGKQVIHPQQIPIVQQAYSPSEKQISWASELIKAFDEQQEDGKGAIVFQGAMIDMPLVLQARNILHLAKMITKTQ